MNKPPSNLTVYDAVLDEPIADSKTEDAVEMDKFQSLLKEYLNGMFIWFTILLIGHCAYRNSVSDSALNRAGSGSVGSNLSTLSHANSSNEFVYDIFYYRPSTVAEQAAAAGMATVTGLPADIDDGYDSASDSELEDEADEDSNGEFFRLGCFNFF